MTDAPPSPRRRLKKALIDEGRLYRRIPILKRLVPSARKRIARLFWRNGRPVQVHPVRLAGIDAPLIITGDSHCGLLAATPRISENYLGPVTMHRVGRDGARVLQLDSANVSTGDALGFCFGEIDVRVHIAKQRDRFGRNPREIVETLATAYLATLRDVRDTFKASPIIVFSIVPPAGDKYPHFNREMPRNGTEHERIAWTVQLNNMLRRGAYRAGFGFVDQYSPFADKRGLLNLRMSHDATYVTPELINRDIELVCSFSLETVGREA